MNDRRRIRARRVLLELTPEQEARLKQAQEEEERALPESIEIGRKLNAAAEEQTLSGALRRAIHAGPAIDLDGLARRAGITPDDLDGFLTGERALPSDAMDRLAAEVGCQLVQPV